MPSAANKADQLSRVPKFFIDCYKRKLAAINETPAVVAAASSLAVVGPVSLDQILAKASQVFGCLREPVFLCRHASLCGH